MMKRIQDLVHRLYAKINPRVLTIAGLSAAIVLLRKIAPKKTKKNVKKLKYELTESAIALMEKGLKHG